MKRILYIILVLLVAACDKTLHFQTGEDYIITEQDQGKDPNKGVVVGFNTNGVTSTAINDLHIFFFDESEMLSRHNYYVEMEEVALEKMLMESGAYTIFTVFNTEEDLLDALTRSSELPSLSLSQLIDRVNGYYEEVTYPEMLTGMVQHSVGNSVEQVTITVTDEPVTDVVTAVSFELTYPSSDMPAFTKSGSTLTHVVAQVNFVQEAEDFVAGDNDLKVIIPKTFSYNVVTGAVCEIDSTSITLSFSNIAEENSGKTIGQSYIFADPSAQTVMSGVTIQFNSEPEKNLDNVPFQANYKTNIKGLYSNTYNSTFTVTSDAGWDQDIEKPLVDAVIYAVGDAYPKDGIAIGVVYSVSADGLSGMVVSLEMATETKWCLSSVQTSATSTDNGLANMRAVWSVDNDYNNHSAFAWVHELNDNADLDTNGYADNTTGVWYLPASGEFDALQNVQSTIDSKIIAAGFEALLSSAYYWSSSEKTGDYGGGSAWGVEMSTTNYTSGYVYKSNEFNVRAVLAV